MGIGIRRSTFLPIPMADNTLSTQGDLKMIFLGVCKEKWFKTVIKAVYYIHTKIILIILIQELNHALIQECHHTIFVTVNTVLFLLFVHLMELYTIRIYHPLDIYIIHHTAFFPLPCCQTYFLLIFILINQGWLLNKWVIGVNNTKKWIVIGGGIGQGGKIKNLRNLINLRKIRLVSS